MKTKVYIDGQAGTTGLQIYDRIGSRPDLELLRIPEEDRHDPEIRKHFLNQADIVFLCLPDKSAIEAVSMIENPKVKVIDASTAHRISPDWTYGFPELSAKQRAAIASSKRIANPGCHATGFIASAAPLVKLGILPADYPLTCFSLTGYSGGGKNMIAAYEKKDPSGALSSPGLYGLNLHHKHIPEMTKMSGLTRCPVFVPIVDNYYKGMATTITLHNQLLPRLSGSSQPTAACIRDQLAAYYEGQHFVTVLPYEENRSTLYANRLAGTNHLQLAVSGHEDQTIITALFDNLGKGASGAAVQNMNIMLSLEEDLGLE